MRRIIWTVAFSAIVVVCLSACGGDSDKNESPPESSAVAPTLPPAAATTSAPPTATPVPPTATPVLAPPVVGPGDGFQIASRGISAPVMLIAVEASGNMPGTDPTVAMIYTWEAFPQFGGLPGQGNTVVYGRRATPAGPAIFLRLPDVQAGDPIRLTLGGQTYDYFVVNKCRVPITSTEEMVRPKSAESLTILTDDNQTGNTHRVVVVAERKVNTLPRDCATGGTPL